MESPGINIIEHASLPAEEVWLIHKKEAALVPPDLRDNLPVPCILTGDAARARRLLSLVRAIDGNTISSGARRLTDRMRR
jgi:hypothetical protein